MAISTCIRPTAVLLAAACALFVAGCGNATTRIRGVTPLNLNDANESTPVAVRIFPLRADSKFRGAAFETLWIDPAAVLGDDLLGKPQQVMVFPGQPNDAPQQVTVADSSSANFIGVMGLYRKSDGLPRTVVLPIQDADRRVIIMTGFGIKLEGSTETPATSSGESAGGDARSPGKTRQR